jgi:magnesium chelatase accessory protein
MDWARDGADWPNRRHSRFVSARPHRWHVQDTGEPGDTRPTILLLHGAGGATHSWRGLLPLLAADARVIAPDLPGQGFSRAGSRFRLGMDFMAEDIARLLETLGATPDAIVGHSAGGALGLWMARRRPDRMARPPRTVVTINGALSPFPGMAGWVFPAMAKLLALNPLTALMVARTGASEASVRSLLENTGSRVDADGLALYRRLVGSRAHVDGTLGMMAQWRLDPLLAALPDIDTPTLMLVGTGDRTVPPETATGPAARLPRARIERVENTGHLLHEEDPARVHAAIRRFLIAESVLPAQPKAAARSP